MKLRLVLSATLLVACNGDDGPGGNTTGTDGGASMTMTLTTMSSLTAMNDTTADGDSDTGGTETEGLDDTSTSTGEPLPECPGRCAGLAPEGWNGPVATVDSDPLEDGPGCPETFEEMAVEAFDDFMADPAVCDCDCGDAVGVLCDQIGTLVNFGAPEDCGGAEIDSTNINNGACVAAPVSSGHHIRLEPVEILSLGQCEPILSVQLDEPSFGTRVTACTTPLMEGFACDDVPDQGCLAEAIEEPLSDTLCIWQEGEHACPADSPYAEARVLHADFDDERGCTECACDDPVGLCDNASVTTYSSNNCTTGVTALATGEGFCTQVTAQSLTARYLAGSPTAFCPALPVEPMGEAIPNGAITLCCTE